MTDERTLQIVVTDGADRGRCFPLLVGHPLLIGREPDCEIVLADTKISRRHAKLTAAGDRVEIQDLDSRNGTFLNEEKISRGFLGKGDVLRVGRTRMEAIRTSARNSSLDASTFTAHSHCSACTKPLDEGADQSRDILHYRVCRECVASSPYLGQVLGNFLVLWRIAEGGAAVLYRAYHTVVETEVALKIFREDFCNNPRAVSRFIREAQIGSQLSHPNIVRFYDAGRVGQTLYIAMEYIRGTDLAGLIAQGPVRPEFVRRVAVDILEALSYTSELRILHRDIKPGNILIPELAVRSLGPANFSPKETVVDEVAVGAVTIHAKLADFNISKAMRDSGLDSSTITQPGSIVGTMFYMPPEQITDFANLDVRADLYSLGISMYEALTARRPFVSHDRNTLARQILSTAPLPPSQVQPGIPVDMNDAILRALAKSPDDRFATPREMIEALTARGG